MNPPQPIPGVGSEISIDVAGRAGESRAIALRLLKPTGEVLLEPPPVMANCDAAGRANLRVPVKLPAEPWLIVEARFTDSDAMPWDDTRTPAGSSSAAQNPCASWILQEVRKQLDL